MKFNLKNLIQSTGLIALALLLMSTANQAIAQSSMQGFAGGGGTSGAKGSPSGSGRNLLGGAHLLNALGLNDKVIPAPKTSGKWQLKYNDPGINVTLLNWNCRDNSIWSDTLKGPINGFKHVWGKYGKSAKAAKGAKEHFDIYLKTVEQDVRRGMKKSPKHGIFSPPFGKTETKTVRYCYTDAEVDQFIAYIKGMFKHLGSHSDPVAEVKRLFP
ncbi:MAG: hypothetical protein G3M70_02145 [Candidatus Nitronauta litoralis]|uniref:Uncharacterized protein n=1 Tax=Candidatus Nitronauta litoralis TaxID=2705533 RepID=A0A7T0BTK1_9BACT|nr:MAG: hypothetical protein G3M70_02145 [Candidatus Nitronauta litoralis]